MRSVAVVTSWWVVVGFGSSICAVEPVSKDAFSLNDDAKAEIEKLFVDIKGADDPGCSVAIQHHGKVIYVRGFGAARCCLQCAKRAGYGFRNCIGFQVVYRGMYCLVDGSGQVGSG